MMQTIIATIRKRRRPRLARRYYSAYQVSHTPTAARAVAVADRSRLSAPTRKCEPTKALRPVASLASARVRQPHQPSPTFWSPWAANRSACQQHLKKLLLTLHWGFHLPSSAPSASHQV